MHQMCNIITQTSVCAYVHVFQLGIVLGGELHRYPQLLWSPRGTYKTQEQLILTDKVYYSKRQNKSFCMVCWWWILNLLFSETPLSHHPCCKIFPGSVSAQTETVPLSSGFHCLSWESVNNWIADMMKVMAFFPPLRLSFSICTLFLLLLLYFLWGSLGFLNTYKSEFFITLNKFSAIFSSAPLTFSWAPETPTNICQILLLCSQ